MNNKKIIGFLAAVILLLNFLLPTTFADNEEVKRITFNGATTVSDSKITYTVNEVQYRFQIGTKANDGGFIHGAAGDDEITYEENTVTITSNGEAEYFLALRNDVDENQIQVRIGDRVERFSQGMVSLSNINDGEEIIIEEAVDEVFHDFDGVAYFAWLCNDGDICYHKLTNLKGRQDLLDENNQPVLNEINEPYQYYETNYIREEDLTDESGNGVDYNLSIEPANWVLPRDVEDEQGNFVASAYDVFGNGEDDMGTQLDPAGANSGNSSYATNGDRCFRAVIYKNGYQAIEFDTTIDKYTYFPGFLDPVFFSSVFDLSGTTKSEPVKYETYILEPQISLRNDSKSAKFTSIKALDVNTEAVTIENNDGEFTIRFNSNYYDSVVFEAIDENGGKYYFQIDRVAGTLEDDARPDHRPTAVAMEFFYPTSLNNQELNYTDFEVIATLNKSDGSKETRIIDTPTNYIDEMTGENLGPKRYGGKNLFVSGYKVDLTDDTVSVNFNTIKKGALTGETFGGAFSGSGDGLTYIRRQ